METVETPATPVAPVTSGDPTQLALWGGAKRLSGGFAPSSVVPYR